MFLSLWRSYEKLYQIGDVRAASRAHAMPWQGMRRLPGPIFILLYLTKTPVIPRLLARIPSTLAYTIKIFMGLTRTQKNKATRT
jgi:hypothetical protein